MKRRLHSKTMKTLLGGAVALSLSSGFLRAQAGGREGMSLPTYPGRTFLEIGGRRTSGDSTVAKFAEYRDIPSGVFIRNFIVNSELPFSGSYFNLRSRQDSEKDLQALASAGVYGRYKITLFWNRLIHNAVTAGRNFYVRSGPGQFNLPSGFQALQGAPRQNLSVERSAVGLGFTLTPSEAWDLRIQYSPERRSGFRPSGNTLGFTVVELPEPVQYRTTHVKASAELAKPKWVVQASSESSLFRNEVPTLEWSGFAQPGERTGAAVSGRRGLAPDNTAQNFTFAGALGLNRSARIVATVSPGWMRQNEAFAPFTIDRAIQARPDYPALPARSLNGSKQTLMMNYLLTGKVGKQFGYNARYRSYRLDNETPSLRFSGYVPYDSTPALFTETAPRQRRNLPYAYSKQNVNVDWSWEPGKTSVARWFYRWEAWDRTYRDVKRSNEHTGGASWDWMNRDGWELRALIEHSRRRPERYDPDYFLASFPSGTGTFALSQPPGLRRLDQAARTRNYGTVTLVAPPTESITVSAAYTVDRAFFRESGYGDLYDLSDAASCDLSYTVTPSISLFADYTYERLRYALRSRQRLDASPIGAANDSSVNDWESNIRDAVHTWGAGLNAGFFRNKLAADVYYGFSQGVNRTTTMALGHPAAEGFLADSAEDYPKLGNRFQRLAVSLRFPLTESISYRLDYAYERYRERDQALEQAAPFLGLTDAASAGFLGMVLPRYRVHIWSVTLGYVF